MHRIDPQADGTLPRPGQAVSRRAVDAVGLWCLAGYAVLAWLSIQPGEPGLASFFSIIGWTALPVFGLYLFLGKVGGHVSVERLLLWALLFRLAGLIGGPLYEDDFYRYLWDGYRFAASGSPYGPAPEAFFGATGIPESFERILDRINHPELATIYGPTTQLAFLLAYWLCPGELAALQLLLVGVDIALIALLLRLAPTRESCSTPGARWSSRKSPSPPIRMAWAFALRLRQSCWRASARGMAPPSVSALRPEPRFSRLPWFPFC